MLLLLSVSTMSLAQREASPSPFRQGGQAMWALTGSFTTATRAPGESFTYQSIVSPAYGQMLTDHWQLGASATYLRANNSLGFADRQHFFQAGPFIRYYFLRVLFASVGYELGNYYDVSDPAARLTFQPGLRQHAVGGVGFNVPILRRILPGFSLDYTFYYYAPVACTECRRTMEVKFGVAYFFSR